MLSLVYSCILVIFVLIVLTIILIGLKRLFNESTGTLELDKKVTVRCPKCGDTYNILESELAGGDGLISVKCYTCGYEYKQKYAIVKEL